MKPSMATGFVVDMSSQLFMTIYDLSCRHAHWVAGIIVEALLELGCRCLFRQSCCTGCYALSAKGVISHARHDFQANVTVGY